MNNLTKKQFEDAVNGIYNVAVSLRLSVEATPETREIFVAVQKQLHMEMSRLNKILDTLGGE